MTRSLSRRVVSFEVFGVAQPKGSAKAFVPKSWAAAAVAQGRAPRAIVTSDNPQAKGWQQLVAEQAQTVAADGMFVGPVVLAVVFYLPRPQSLPKRVLHHTKKPDVDKLTRCAADALRRVLYQDDSQVIRIIAEKRYAAPASAPKAVITVAEASDPPIAQTAFSDHDLFSEEVLHGATT